MDSLLQLRRAETLRALHYHARRCVILSRLVEDACGGLWAGSVSLEAARLFFSVTYYESDDCRRRADADAVVAEPEVRS